MLTMYQAVKNIKARNIDINSPVNCVESTKLVSPMENKKCFKLEKVSKDVIFKHKLNLGCL